MKEEAILLGQNKSLVGVYTPAVPKDTHTGSKVAIIFLNAGLIHHVGPHCLHVRLARLLASRGVSALRFDLSGIGDSPVRQDKLPARQVVINEPREVMDDLVRRGYDSFILFGICSGAKNAVQAASGDPRVRGLVLVNPGVDNPDVILQATSQLYMRRSLWNARAWLNLFTGRVNYKALVYTLIGSVRQKLSGNRPSNEKLPDLIRQGLEPVMSQGTRLLVLLSDRHAQLFKLFGNELQDLLHSRDLQLEVFPEADHLFTLLEKQEFLVEHVCLWVEKLQHAIPDTDITTS